MRTSVLSFVVLLSACQSGKIDLTDAGLVGDSGSSDGGADGGGDGGGETVDGDGDGSPVDEDCDDNDATAYPGATEVCDGVDNDCDGNIDDGAGTVWYSDSDSDGYGDSSVTLTACAQPEGYVALDGDCDDSDPLYHPGADESDCSDPNDYNCDGSAGTDDNDGDGWAACEDCDDGSAGAYPGAAEVCDDSDNDCDGAIDDDAADALTWYGDSDGDGYGDPAATSTACDQPAGSVSDSTDCNDSHATIFPGAEEVCDGFDNDCDGGIDEEVTGGETWYADVDGDGYGDASASIEACDEPSGYTKDTADCDDSDAAVNPAAHELCDEVDNDCDSLVDDDDPDIDATSGGKAYYTDSDGDGYGAAGTGDYYCDKPAGTSTNYKDCDDADAEVHAASTEVCDDKDNDCDGDTDWGLRVPTDHGTIQDAIDASTDGDTVCVAAGTYSETIDFDGHEIEVLGVDGSASTTIDGGGSGPVVSFQNGESAAAMLTGFTISGGDASQGAGVYVNGADPTLDDLVVTDNDCSGTSVQCYGVGLYASSSDLSLSNSSVSENQASASSYGGNYGYAYGIGVYLSGSDVVFDQVEVAENAHTTKATYYALAYGLGVNASNSDVVWTGGSVWGNSDKAGAAYGTGYGGGIYTSGGDFTLSQAIIADNSLTGGYYGYGGGVYAAQSTDLVLTNVVIANNSVGGGGGSAMGGGLYLYYYVDAYFENCDIVGNGVSGGYYEYGGGIFGYYYADIEMINTNVVGNSASSGGALGAWYAYYGGSTDISYSNFYDNGSDPFENYTDPTGSDGNIAVDPSYADTSATDGVDWDLSLSAGSSCIDAGDPGYSDADGSTADIGAYGGPNGSW